MQNTFFQKLILTAVCGALAAGLYVYVYKGVIVSAERSVRTLPTSIR